MPVQAKICGLKTIETLNAAVEGGAVMVGFNFFPRSPRYLTPEAASALASQVPAHVKRVGLLVDVDDAGIADLIAKCPLDLLQLHGKESPERVTAIRSRFGKPVIKVISIETVEDVNAAIQFEPIVDYLMFDTKPPRSMVNALPGGNAVSFDWSILSGREFQKPWLLAGGLTSDNLRVAVTTTGARLVDVSSGVEDRPGEKNPSKIKAFLEAAGRL